MLKELSINEVKILAMYLPQYHTIPENDEFWGKGFTDWVTVKNAKPLFEGHRQPRVPLNNNYYDLSIKENVKWQCKLANDYGIYGFGVYHYWFNDDKNLLTKPAEIIFENKDIDIHYFYAWDNTSWKRSWSNIKEEGNAWAPLLDNGVNIHQGKSVLIPYELGKEDNWERHYMYLLPFFKDKRYIKVGNKPLFVIFHYSNDVANMCKYWDELAKKDGFDGVYFVFRYDITNDIPSNYVKFKYEPQSSGNFITPSLFNRIKRKIKKSIYGDKYLDKYSYDDIWKNILKNAQAMKQSDILHGAFVSYDDTPRRGMRGIVVNDSTPEKFKFYLHKLLKITASQRKNFVFLTAWNEWGEGAFLEPDDIYKFDYLQAIKDIY